MSSDHSASDRIAHLTISASDLTDALGPIVRASGRSAANDATFSFANGDLVIEAAGVSATVPATGVWSGVATVPKSALGMLARISGQLIEIRLTDGRLYIGTMSFDARWYEGGLPQIDLPLDPPLLEVLRLRQLHSDEVLLARGLLDRVVQAETERDHYIESAVLRLMPLGDFRSAINKLVRDALDRRISYEEARTIPEQHLVPPATAAGPKAPSEILTEAEIVQLRRDKNEMSTYARAASGAKYARLEFIEYLERTLTAARYRFRPLTDEAEFWSHFPSDEPSFREFVREPGLVICATLLGEQGPTASDEPGPSRTLLSLPDPPRGYYWAGTSGGLRSPGHRSFRLWHRELGAYGPPPGE